MIFDSNHGCNSDHGDMMVDDYAYQCKLMTIILTITIVTNNHIDADRSWLFVSDVSVADFGQHGYWPTIGFAWSPAV